jgi:hypothetical protein
MNTLKALADTYWADYKRTEASRAKLVAGILTALDSGMSQAEVVRQSGYTRERIRLIALGRKG